MTERVINRDINSRIETICNTYFDGNATKMAKTCFVSRTTLLSIIGNQQSAPGYETLRRIIDMSSPRISIDWLLTGRGDMLEQDTEVAPEAVPEISYTEGVPYYDEVFECGFDELIAPSSENPEYLIRMPGYERATLWCNASGHSMEPEINNGDIIALQRIQDFSFLPFGDVYGIITTNGMRTIKRLGKSNVEGCYRLIPTNKEYDEQDIPINKIALVYRVLGTMKAF